MSKITSKKIVLIGPSAVGKTSLVLKLLSGKFNQYSESTIGASFCSKLMIANDGVQDKVEIWDTAGQERYKSLVPMYYRNAGGALIVYDVTNKNSIEKAKEWIDEIKSKASSDIKIIVVGNKIDLSDNQSELNNLKHNFEYDHFLVSAKTGKNVVETFKELISSIPRYTRDESKLLPRIKKQERSCC